MSNAYKCDVVNCNEIAEGQPAGDFVVNALGVRKHLCQKHTDEIVISYFSDLIAIDGSGGGGNSQQEE